MTALLDERELTADERQAIADESRPGVWIETFDMRQTYGGPNEAGDGRTFTQEETDYLVVREIIRVSNHASDVWTELALWNRTVHVSYGDVEPKRIRPAESQRGGIHSDPLVRLLAYRAWGDRDRRWFDLNLSAAEALTLKPGRPAPAESHGGHNLVSVTKWFDPLEGWRLDVCCTCKTIFRVRVAERTVIVLPQLPAA